MKYACPACGSAMELQRAFDGMMHVSCACGAGDVLEYAPNPDEVFLEFLSRHDRGAAAGAPGGGMTRTDAEMELLIGEKNPDALVRGVLGSKRDYVADYRVLRDPEPEMGRRPAEAGLDPRIAGYLEGAGISRLYRFQDEAISAILAGENVVIEAPTASGKTEAFTVPAVQRAAAEGEDGGVFAVFVYPTKALARDQLPKITRIAASAGVRAAVFDGDTGRAERAGIADRPPQILVTNFDSIHHHMWRRTRLAGLLAGARMLVADEAHVYTGIFGSNVHHVIARLGRLCGGRLQCVAASATLAGAGGFCGRLFGAPVRTVRGSGRRGRTDFVMLFPSLRPQRSLMADLAGRLARGRHRTMMFSNSHRGAELLAIQAKRQGLNVAVHRAGLVPAHRESVERRFREGAVDAVSCTPTLELGIDVGAVDGVISAAVPVNRLVQRIGRAARKGQRGYAFLALGNDPISQYYRNHPGDYFEDAEVPCIDPANPYVQEFQALAAACDRPVGPGELAGLRGAMEGHVGRGTLRKSGGMIGPAPGGAAGLLSKYSIRGIGGSIDIMHGGRKAGDRVLPAALEELHPGAVYLLAGARYSVSRLAYPAGGYATVERLPRDYPYHTRALKEEWPEIEEVCETRTAGGTEVAFCRLRIEKKVTGYVTLELGEDAAQGERTELAEPLTYDLVTKGIVFHAPRPSDAMRSGDPGYVEASGYHATEHVMIEGTNMVTGGASQDLGGIAMGESGLVFIYDGAVGGSGASRALYDRFGAALGRAVRIVAECPCTGEAGCPRCTFSYRCGNNNEYLHKAAALEILSRMERGEESGIVGPADGDRPLV